MRYLIAILTAASASRARPDGVVGDKPAGNPRVTRQTSNWPIDSGSAPVSAPAPLGRPPGGQVDPDAATRISIARTDLTDPNLKTGV